MARLPLEGIRVAGITTVWAGTFTSQMLADWGAEVIRVESCQNYQTLTRGYLARPPKGFALVQNPWRGGYPDLDPYGPKNRSWNRFPWFNNHARNKLSMTVDLTRPEGMDIFKRLIAKTDVFIENNAPDTMQKLGITYQTLKEARPDLIVIDMPGFGLSGPYRDYRVLGAHLECVGGHTSLRGYPELDPTTITYVYHCDAASGACGALAAVMAVRYRNRTGKGQHIEVAQIETLFPQLGQAVMDYTMNQRVQRSVGNRDPHSAAPCGCYRCRGDDRWVTITIGSDKEWEGFCRALGNPPWTKDERFSDALSRYKNQDDLDKLVEEWTTQHDHHAVMHMLQKEGIPAGPVMDERDCYNDPHVKERGFHERVTHPECGTHLYPGLTWKASKTPNSIRSPACLLGEHNEYVYKKVIGVSDKEYTELEKEGHIGMDFVPGIP